MFAEVILHLHGLLQYIISKCYFSYKFACTHTVTFCYSVIVSDFFPPFAHCYALPFS